MLLLPLPLARNNENGNTEFRLLIGCCRQGRILSEMNLQESRIFLIISTPSLTFLILFIIINTEF